MSGHNGHKNGNGSDPAKTAPATASGSQSGSGDTLEFDVPDWRTASFVTVSALSVVLPIESVESLHRSQTPKSARVRKTSMRS